ncbi:hypothetical protein ACFLU1_06355 [Chloroflexota bacterium]
MNNERKLGYSCEITLEQLLGLYASSSEFKNDEHYIVMQPELIHYRLKQLKRGRRGEPLVLGLMKYRDNYSRLTKKWGYDWKVLLKTIPDDVRLETERIAEKWALKGFPESQVEAENRRLNKAREVFSEQKDALETQVKASQDATINVPQLEDFVKQIQDKLPKLDFEGKRLALDMLGITVWLDGETIEVTGVIDPEDAIVTTRS